MTREAWGPAYGFVWWLSLIGNILAMVAFIAGFVVLIVMPEVWARTARKKPKAGPGWS